MADLSKLSDEELVALLLLLGEQAQQITNATGLVRKEQADRLTRVDATGRELNDFGVGVLEEAVRAAPARAVEIAAGEAEQARLEAITAENEGVTTAAAAADG